MVAGSVPDEATEHFSLSNPFSRTMALGFTQPLTEIRNKNLSEDKVRPESNSGKLIAICELIFYKVWDLPHLNPTGLHCLFRG
jgi:hypothetical protein